MKLAKSLLLGSAAGLVAVTGAQAADLPVRAAAPVDYVRTCPNAPIGGTGFFVIPGTETCLRISGYVRAEARFAENDEYEAQAARDFRLDPETGLVLAPTAAQGIRANQRDQNDVSLFARGSVAFDARTPTEFGTLRSFIRMSVDNAGTGGGSTVGFNQAFIQFAGLTAGRITSFFDFFTTNLVTGTGGSSDATTNVFAYTATFGAGFSATIAVEDAYVRRGDLGGGVGYGGQELPNLVANLNVTQAWGSAQLSGALQQIRHDDNTATADDELGWAVSAGVNVFLPMIAAGDALWIQATYADGAIGYVNVPTSGTNFAVPVNDATFIAASNSLETTEAWAIKAAFRHFWTPTFWQDVEGAYGQVEQDRANPLVGNQLITTAQDYDWWQLGTRLNWSPVSGLTFSGDVVYTQIETDRPYVIDTAANVVSDEASRWAGRIRIQRDF